MPDHEWRQIRVTFRKAVSDGNYGTESAEVTLEDWVEADGSIEIYAGMSGTLLGMARALVHAELERSPSQRVRSAIDSSVPGKPIFSAAESARLSRVLQDDDGEE